MLVEALLVADLIIDAASSGSNETTAVSFSTLGESAFGVNGGRAISGTFVALMMARIFATVKTARGPGGTHQ